MKFNTIKEAFKKANVPRPSVPSLSEPKPLEPCPPPIRPIPLFNPQSKRELVAGGEVIWKPVDRQAAKLLMKSSWIHQPPIEDSKPISITPTPVKKKKVHNHQPPKKGNKMNKVVESGGQLLGGRNSDISTGQVEIQGETLFDEHSIVRRVVESINNQPKELSELARASLDARGVLRDNLKELGSGMEEFKIKSSASLEDLRQMRMSFISEVFKMTTSLKDIRQFFLGSDYEQQITRLREFVGLCERLYKLKESGFLDAIADTMLKLDDTK